MIRRVDSLSLALLAGLSSLRSRSGRFGGLALLR
jgi:hypothetical protein